jgi:hypothetical protein
MCVVVWVAIVGSFKMRRYAWNKHPLAERCHFDSLCDLLSFEVFLRVEIGGFAWNKCWDELRRFQRVSIEAGMIHGTNKV